MKNQGLRRWGVSLALAVTVIGSQVVSADVVRTQVVELNSGWNAVYLLVEPLQTDPEKLFDAAAIDVVATYFPARSTAQFISDPSVDGLQDAGWGLWYAPGRPDSFLTDLYAVHGNHGYLIHAREATVLEIEGVVEPLATRWAAAHYNLVGYSLNRQGPPTFGQFFSAEPSLAHDRIYRLVGGAWRRVTTPASTLMRSGEAFWIYCDGASEYAGPVTMTTKTRVGLVLQGSVDSLVLRNHLDHPVTPTLFHVAEGDAPTPLSLVIDVVGEGDFGVIDSAAVATPDGGWDFELPAMEARSSIQIPFELRLEDMERRYHSSLLKLSTDIGFEIWTPVFGIRADLDE